MGKLTAKQVENLREPGIYEDGSGLRMLVDKNGNRRWRFRYQLRGKRREMGLGAFPLVSLKSARDTANEHRILIQRGTDPLVAKRQAEADRQAKELAERTFEEIAAEYIEAHRGGWRNPKHADQWEATLDTYAYPKIGKTLVNEVSTADVLRVIQPIWQKKAETASRIRGRIELVLDAAKAQGYRTGDNPARWRGHLDKLLPPRSKVAPVKHRPAMPFDEVAAFMTYLANRRSGSFRALEFTILTAARSGEVLNATWAEIDWKTETWTVPGNRMKAGRPHRVPLSSKALEVLKQQLGHHEEWIFPGQRQGRPLSNMAMIKVMRDAEIGHYVPHGFRSSFRDWAAECTPVPNHVVEMALAHTVGNAVEAAYRRGDLFEKRRELMAAWANFATDVKAAVQA